jgi:hypothetical protein
VADRRPRQYDNAVDGLVEQTLQTSQSPRVLCDDERAAWNGAGIALRAELTAGFEARDQAIATNNDQLFQRSNPLLREGHIGFAQAYAAFPGYARPQPAPSL